MTRADLTEAVYQAIEMPRKESDSVVCAIFDSIVRALRSGDKVEIRGFGSFLFIGPPVGCGPALPE
jgi:integration host factor subunit beta